MAGHPRRWKRCSWPSRPPWKPGNPNTHRGASPSNGRPGSPKPPRCWAAETPCKPWCGRALSPSASTAWELDTGWLEAAADRVLSSVEERRSTWQIWHVRAEAQRYIRAADIPTTQANRLVDLIVDEVLNSRSISLARP